MKIQLNRNTKKHIFCCLILALPLLQFTVFYIVVNFNQILMCFQEYTVDQTGRGSYIFLDNAFDNFKTVFSDLKNEPKLVASVKNSSIALLTSLLFGTGLALVFSSYIYHKRVFSKFYKIVLFMPNIVSIVVLANVFTAINENAIPQLLFNWFDVPIERSMLLKNPDYKFATVLIFTCTLSFGVQVLSYSGAMSGISESIVEAAQLDGVNIVQEFIYVSVPMIWPTIISFVTVSLSGYFSSQLNLFTFYDTSADPFMYTYGYYLFLEVKKGATNFSMYPVLSTMGIIFTAFITPIIFIVRKLMRKYGPSVD